MFGAILLQQWTKANFSRLVARKDVDAIMRGWSDDGVLEMPGTSAMSGRFEGKAAVRAWVARWFDSTTAIDFDVKRIALTNTLALGFGTNDVMIEWEVHETSKSGAAIRARGITVWELRGGKLAAARDYFFDPSVLNVIHGPRPAAAS
jgi:ketosteroid isomerase-like protein